MNTDSHLNVALLGYGRIAGKHLSALQTLKRDGVSLRSICDIDKSKLPDRSLPENILQIRDREDHRFLEHVDLGVVLTESGNHFKDAKFFLEKNIDVLIEKPATLKLTDANELANIAKLNKRKIYVVKQNRFNKAVEFAKKNCQLGKLGKLNLGTVRVRWCRPQDYYDQAEWRGTWRLDGGVISNQASHHIDLLQYFMGPVKKVFAYAKTFGVDVEVEDTLVAILEFETGAIGTFEATTAVRPRNIEGSVSLIGSKGLIEIGGFAANEIVRCELNEGPKHESLNLGGSNDTNDVYGEGHLQIYKEILNDRMGLPNRAVDLASALESLQIIHMMYMSIEQCSEISVNDLGAGSIRLGKKR